PDLRLQQIEARHPPRNAGRNYAGPVCPTERVAPEQADSNAPHRCVEEATVRNRAYNPRPSDVLRRHCDCEAASRADGNQRHLRRRRRPMKKMLVVVLCAGLYVALGAQTQTTPRYQFDPGWPKPMPNKWKIGGVTGLAVAPNDDTVWVYDRPNDLTNLELEAE